MTLAAIEAGGTKFVAGLFRVEISGHEPPEMLARASIPTSSPEETLTATADFIERQSLGCGAPDAIGIGSFGPVELKRSSPSWGCITSTPKPGWSGVDVAGYFRKRFSIPVAFDTDVNAAAYGEYLWGGASGINDFIYITVGTGIGGGIFSGGGLVHGMMHPEIGHIKIGREPSDAFEGACPFHRDCLEGLASGPAIEKRWGRAGIELPADHPAWQLEARYLARAIAAYTLVVSPELILLGGGIGMRPGLAENVCLFVGEELAGYVPALVSPERLATFVQRPALGANAGLVGSAALALRFCAE
jgi:fructokinase